MASSLTTREITIIILACAVAIVVPTVLYYRFVLAPVERRLRHWASTLNYEFVRYNEPAGFLDRPRAPWSWIWAPWGVWRVTVRDKAGLERVALVRLRTLHTNPAPGNIRWEEERAEPVT